MENAEKTNGNDELLEDAINLVKEEKGASVSLL